MVGDAMRCDGWNEGPGLAFGTAAAVPNRKNNVGMTRKRAESDSQTRLTSGVLRGERGVLD